jgi:hypothetical protein
MKPLWSVLVLLSLAACGDRWEGPTTPTTQPEATKTHPTVITIADPSPVAVVPVKATPVMVLVASETTGTSRFVVLSSEDPLPPSCAWRNKVVEVHLKLACGEDLMPYCDYKNDIVTLANLHRVFIQDTGYPPFYKLDDNPGHWCAK